MSIRARLHGGNARHPVGSIFLAFVRNRASRGQFLFSLATVAAPLALVVGLVVAGSALRGASPITTLAEPGTWNATTAPAVAPIPTPVAVIAIDTAVGTGDTADGATPAEVGVASTVP